MMEKADLHLRHFLPQRPGSIGKGAAQGLNVDIRRRRPTMPVAQR
jgi:hypothetical protein